MRRNMERSALGASVLLVMSSQAHANSEMVSMSNAISFGYQEHMPSYSQLDPQPTDSAIIGVNNNFSDALAADLGYGLQASGVFSELTNPIQSVQAYQYKKKRIEYKTTQPVIDLPDKIVSANKTGHDVDDQAYYQAVNKQAADIVPDVTELNESSTNDELYAEASIDKIRESVVYPSEDAHESYKSVNKKSEANHSDRIISISAKKNNNIQDDEQEYLLIDIPGYDTPSHNNMTRDFSSIDANVIQQVSSKSEDSTSKSEQEYLVDIQANNTQSKKIIESRTNLRQAGLYSTALESVSTAELSSTFAREGVGQQAMAENQQSKAEVKLPKKISEVNATESTAAVAEKTTNKTQTGTVSKEMVEAQRKELAKVANANTPPTTTPSQEKEKKVVEATPSMVVDKPKTADDALKKNKDDASSEKNLKEVFTASEKRYSLLKKGNWGLNYDARYSYFRDSRIDIATEQNSSKILRFRVEEDAQHSLSNTLGLQYGLRDNLTVSADVPIIAKSDLQKDVSTVGLGDVGLGVRWEPFPLEKGRLPVIINANVSLPTGDSPYKVDKRKDLSTGKGYYSFGGGVSTRKYVDPVVLFGSASINYGLPERDLNQSLGNNRFLVGIKPNLSMGAALGFAYSLNYDVSLTMSYQQAFAVGSEFTVRERDETESKIIERTTKSADQTSSTLNMALGIRVSPKTIVNTSVGIGLTEDTPDVSFGVSFPLNFAGFGKKK